MKKYFVIFNGEKQGPFSLNELKSKDITSVTLFWHEGLENWVNGKDIEEIANLLKYIPPQIPKKEKENKLRMLLHKFVKTIKFLLIYSIISAVIVISSYWVFYGIKTFVLKSDYSKNCESCKNISEKEFTNHNKNIYKFKKELAIYDSSYLNCIKCLKEGQKELVKVEKYESELNRNKIRNEIRRKLYPKRPLSALDKIRIEYQVDGVYNSYNKRILDIKVYIHLLNCDKIIKSKKLYKDSLVKNLFPNMNQSNDSINIIRNIVLIKIQSEKQKLIEKQKEIPIESYKVAKFSFIILLIILQLIIIIYYFTLFIRWYKKKPIERN